MAENRTVSREQWERYIAAHRKGDLDATDFLIDRALRLAQSTATAVIADKELASEVAQEVVIVVLRRASSLRDPERFDGWVHRISVRESIRTLKRHRRYEAGKTTLEGLSSSEQASLTTSPHEGVANRVAAVQHARTAIATLPERQQLALTLRYVHDLSERQIASAMRCRVGTVTSLLSRARSTLRTNPELVALSENRGE